MFCFLTMVSFVLFLCCNKKKTNDYPDITENNSKKTVCDEINIIRDTVILKDSISKKIIIIMTFKVKLIFTRSMKNAVIVQRKREVNDF